MMVKRLILPTIFFFFVCCSAQAKLSSDLLAESDDVRNKAIQTLLSLNYSQQKEIIFHVFSNLITSFEGKEEFFGRKVVLDKEAFSVLEHMIDENRVDMRKIINEFKDAYPDVYYDLNDVFHGLFTGYSTAPRLKALSAYYLGYFDNQIERSDPDSVIQALKERGLGDKDKTVRANSEKALKNMGVELKEADIIRNLKETYILGEGGMAGTYIYSERWLKYKRNKDIKFTENWKNEIGRINNLLPSLMRHLKDKGLTEDEMNILKLKDLYPVSPSKKEYAISMSYRFEALVDPAPITSITLIARKANGAWSFQDVYYTYKHQGDNGTFFCSIHDVFDLNNDKSNELIFDCNIWEGSYLKVYSLDSNKEYELTYEGN